MEVAWSEVSELTSGTSSEEHFDNVDGPAIGSFFEEAFRSVGEFLELLSSSIVAGSNQEEISLQNEE